MLDFMIIGLPRSGTTWAANWLTTNDTFCLHDPLYKLHYSEWDTDRKHFPHPMDYRLIGASCTAIWRFPEYVNAHPANKIVVMRDFQEIQDSLDQLGLPQLNDDAPFQLEDIEAPRVQYTDLFDPERAPLIWEKLVGPGYCPHRHKALSEIHMEPFFEVIEPDFEVTKRLHDELNN